MSAATNGTARDGEVGARVPASPAARARAYRARKQQQLDAAVTAPIIAPGAPSVTVQRRDGRVTLVATFAAALMLAATSATFSVIGLVHVFTGAPAAVICLGVSFECAKLAAVAWLGRCTGPVAVKLALVVLVGMLVTLNTVGAYGFLAHAHLEHVVTGELAIDGRAAGVQARIQAAAAALADVDERVGQVDRAINETTRRGRTRSALDLITAQAKHRGELAAERVTAATKLGDLEVETAAVRGEREKLAADSGPVRYLAELLHVDDAALMRVFILAIAALLDPAAVLLLLAATSSMTAGLRTKGSA